MLAMQLLQTCEMDPSSIRFELLTGHKKNGGLQRPYLVGYSFLPEGSEIYEIKLMMLPRHTYFLKRNYANENYTVFAKQRDENGSHKFLDPVGHGRMSPDLNKHIEIYFPLLGRVIYLDLVPSNS